MNIFSKKFWKKGDKEKEENKSDDDQQQQNSNLILKVSPQYFTLIPDQNKIQIPNQLRIDRKTKQMSESKEFKEEQDVDIYKFDGFLGFLKILDVEYALFIENGEEVCKFQQHVFYQIEDVQFIQISPEDLDISKQVKEFQNGIAGILKTCHYFSYTYQLGSKYSDNLIINKNINNSGNLQKKQRQVNKYMWNRKMFQNYFVGIDQRWIIQLIQGFIGFFEVEIDNEPLQLYLISRRSSLRAGTRYNHRGADPDGNPANYVESEQIVIYKNKITSYLIVRGSVPLLWEQKGDDQVIKMYEGQEMSSQAFKKHFSDMKEEYKQIISVNLMKRTENQEKKLIEAYEQCLGEHDLNQFNLSYEYFDFNSNKSQLNSQTEKYRKCHTEQFEHFTYDLNTSSTQNQQQGVFRVNCKDCLDRTNTYMMKIAMCNLEHVLQSEYNVNLEKIVQGSPLVQMDLKNTGMHPLLKNFKYAWAESGDNISLIYAGTDAATTRLTKKGYSGFSNKMKHTFTCAKVGTQRLVQSKFQDSHKQECIDVLLGNHTKSKLDLPFDVREQLMQDSIIYEKHDISIYTVSLNVQKNTSMQDNTFLPDFFNFDLKSLPEIIVVGLQELAEHKMFKVHNEEVIVKWKNIIEHNIQAVLQGSNIYNLVDTKDMSGNLILIYAQKQLTDKLTDIYHDSIKYGHLDNFAEHGAQVIHLAYCGTSMCFINAYLPSGRKHQDRRYDAIKQIHRKSFQKKGVGKYKKTMIEEHDLAVLFGDLNFRVDMDFKKANQTIVQANQSTENSDKQKIIDSLLQQDEFNVQCQKNKQYISHYKEPKVTFVPTYNDTSKKQRTASWRTRCLYYTKKQSQIAIDAENIIYKSSPNYFYKKNLNTDHVPVYCTIKATVSQIDAEKSGELLEKIMRERNLISENIQELPESSDQDSEKQENNISQDLIELPENQFNSNSGEKQLNSNNENLNNISHEDLLEMGDFIPNSNNKNQDTKNIQHQPNFLEDEFIFKKKQSDDLLGDDSFVNITPK